MKTLLDPSSEEFLTLKNALIKRAKDACGAEYYGFSADYVTDYYADVLHSLAHKMAATPGDPDHSENILKRDVILAAAKDLELNMEALHAALDQGAEDGTDWADACYEAAGNIR